MTEGSSPTPKEAKPVKILTLPSSAKILHTECKKVKEITPEIKALAHTLESYLVSHQNNDPRPIAVSAPQVGECIRLFTSIMSTEGDITTVINPELVYVKKLHLVAETCLSIPGKSFKLKRGKFVKIRGMTLDGSIHSFKGHGIIAQMFQHELNHLDGVTIDTIATRIP